MRINTNVSALNAFRNLSNTESALSRSMERLSSGFRINRAADDAAGLGIANKLRADNRALTQASRNAEQANSVLQITEGATGTIQSMLERMKELATQAGSDSVDDAGRGRIDAEFDALREEITRTVSTTKFQGQALLDGTFGDAGATLETGDITSLSASVTGGTYALSVDSSTGALTVTGPSSFSQTVNLADASFASGQLSFAVSGLGTIAVDADSATDIESVVAGLDGRGFDITAAGADTAAGALDAPIAGVSAFTVDSAVAAGDYTFAVDATSGSEKIDILDSTSAVVGTIDLAGYTDGTDISFNDGGFTFTIDGTDASTDTLAEIKSALEAATLTVTVTAGAAASVTADSITGNPEGEQASFLVGSSGSYSTSDLIKLSAIDLSVSALGIDASDLSTAEGARTALTAIDSAMDTLNETLGDIGANQNRIQYAQENLRTTIQNFSAAESVIRDVDMAEEMTKFSKNQILQQAGTAMLAQANQLGQGVLQLLRG
jgi:flagellin